MTSKRLSRALFLFLVLVLPLFLIGSIFFAHRSGYQNGKPPPLGELKAARTEKWQSQEFVNISKDEDLKKAVAGFSYNFDEPLSTEEAQALTNAVIDFLTAFQKGTYEAYAKFRAPVNHMHFSEGVSNAMWKVFDIPVATIKNDPAQAFKLYWYASKKNNIFTNYWIAVCVTNSNVRVERSSCPTNDLHDSLTINSPTFTVDSLRDTVGFGLQVQGGADPVINYVKSKLSPSTMDLLLNHKGGSILATRAAVIKDFNRLIQEGPLLDVAEFKNTKLSPWTQDLLKTNPKGDALIRLNRFVLADALPEGILKSSAWAENIGMGWTIPSVLLEPSREQVFQAAGGYVKIATIKVFTKPRDNDPIYPVYLRWAWSPKDQKWLPEMLISMYSMPKKVNLFF